VFEKLLKNILFVSSFFVIGGFKNQSYKKFKPKKDRVGFKLVNGALFKMRLNYDILVNDTM